ncbi:conserved protein of unknown function [Rhodovastum atsumiense]|uniref:Hsp70 family protein n=1 Tax=Rhodovastum atsumiense TaxID=504468 RepID=A0A5M6IR36_9PROT|nr:hypothetical protein [Rhodovastum atsumiense]KAA5609988.1 hypothetical protein F1189_21565 [Rhodovastum atsumiense]CAH2598630.1 conserved protein of unknown function [Rhodovastum atsumiense]
MPENLEIIGFDLGHGETALAHTTLASANEPEALAIHNRPTVLSVVGVDHDGQVAIGDHAIRQSERLVEMFVRFKSLPPEDGPWPGERALTLFVGGLVRELVDSRQVPQLEQARVFVGVPSGWTTARDGIHRLRRYREALEAAGLGQVEFVPESRAAFMHARESGELQVQIDQLYGRVLVVDLGSSTADFTLVQDLNPLPLDFGNNALGAGLIEQTLLAQAVARHEDAAKLRAFYQKHPARHAFDELSWRTLKEEYFNAEASGVPEPKARNIFDYELGRGEEVLLRAVIDRPAMEAALAAPQPLLDGLGWSDAYRTTLDAARGVIEGDPDLVLFTGGASRMGFVTRIAQEIFPRTRVLRGKAPELAIAKGLAWWGRSKLRAAAFTREVEALCAPSLLDRPGASSAIGEMVRAELPRLLDALAPVLAERIAERVILPWGRAWRLGQIATLQDFERQTEVAAAAWVDSADGRQAIAEVAQAWLPGLAQRLEALTDPICDRYRLSRRALVIEPTTQVSGELFAGRTADAIDFSHVQGFATVVNLITAVVVGTLMGGSGKALLIAGPIGWVIGFLGAAILFFIGQEAVKERVRGWVIPVMLRKAVMSEERLSSRLRAGVDEMAGKLRADLAARSADDLAVAIEARIKAALLSRAEDALVRLG